ncbi:spore coat protein U domain-containing protein [Burkholderia sp. Ac-20353]|uniref:Csu type fimbrial protein n=1 Tax=Burkholderia sp. Ac-20353 TaxID=2703894 RepID=UPI00197BB6C8|nr:spore coat protein U domain-containing protein [Burkholderia sp. Ac-20353]MBN3787165.1 spore coat protein U domain-containing protein [Burkholderia sp. Ac-20353]
MKTQWKVLVAVACASACMTANAQSNQLAGTVQSQLVLTTGCAINSGSGSVGSTNFGTLDFGTQPSGFTGALTTKAAGSGAGGTTQVTCSPDVTSVQVTIDGGQNAAKGTAVGTGTRALANGSAYVPYEVFADNARAKQYVAGTVQSVPVPTPGAAFDLPIYGVVNKTSSDALAAGTYTDTLNVTLGW